MCDTPAAANSFRCRCRGSDLERGYVRTGNRYLPTIAIPRYLLVTPRVDVTLMCMFVFRGRIRDDGLIMIQSPLALCRTLRSFELGSRSVDASRL